MHRVPLRCCFALVGLLGFSVALRAQESPTRDEFPSWLMAASEEIRSREPPDLPVTDSPDVDLPAEPPQPIDAAMVRSYVRSQERTSVIAAGFQPWWQPTVSAPFQLAQQNVVLQGDDLILESLQHSYRIASLHEKVTIAQAGIMEAAAEFDPTAFLDSKFVRTSLPTGSSLEAGIGVSRLREEDFSTFGGLRRKTQTGAQFEIRQQLGLRDSNSQFFTPPNQGNSRLTLSFNQPLLAGSGRAVNRSLIVLAKLDTQIADQAARAAIQDHLIAVQDAMWNLYFHRVSLLLRISHLRQAESIHRWLQGRQALDALLSQIKRAEAAVASRNSELSRAVTAIRNSEDRLRSLVNSPDLAFGKSVEIIPAEPPSCDLISVSLEDAVVTALASRNELNELAREIDAARVRLNIACNELLPMLDLVLESYVSGLRGEHNIGGSWIDQFSVGEPSYTAGFVFEVPLQRRAAKANVSRRQAQIRQLSNRLQDTISQLHLEVATAVREVQTSHREMESRYLAMQAAREYVTLISERWRNLPGDGLSSNSMLEDLLNAQDRLLAEETSFARAQVDYASSITGLKRAMGTLLQID